MSKTWSRRAILLPLLLLVKNEGRTTVSAQPQTPRTNNTVYQWDDPSSIPGPRDPSRLLPRGGNACDPGASEPVGYGCVHMALMSDDMLAAAKYDQLEKDFLYGVAGGPDDTHCGECHQIQVGSVENSGVWIPDFKQLIIQVVNSGGDVESKQFEIMMGAGGMGFMQAVNRDCSMENKPDADVGDSSNNHLHHCGGGPCNSAGGMFAGDYNAWTMPGKRGCYDGGIRALNASDRRLTQLCKGLSNGETALKDRILFDSCYRTNKYAWHQDFLSYRRVRVQCPEALYRLTGLRRQDEVDGSIQLPQAHIDNVLPEECEAGGRPCIGTMMDGCMPSCSWSRPDFFTASQDYPRVDWCDANNQPQ